MKPLTPHALTWTLQLVASQELGVTEEELEERLASLAVLLPDLAPRLVQAPPERVAAMAAGVEVIGQRLTALRALLPDANVSRLVERRLSLLLEEDLGQVSVHWGEGVCWRQGPLPRRCWWSSG